MAFVNTDDLVSVSDAARRGIADLIRDVDSGREPIIIRDDQPVAALVSIRTLERMQQLEDDLADLALLTARSLTDSGERTPLDRVFHQLGYARDQLTDVEG